MARLWYREAKDGAVEMVVTFENGHEVVIAHIHKESN